MQRGHEHNKGSQDHASTCLEIELLPLNPKPCRPLSSDQPPSSHHGSAAAETPILKLGVRIRGTLGDIDPLDKVPLKRATSVGFGRVPFERGLPQYYLGKAVGSQEVVCLADLDMAKLRTSIDTV